MKAWKIVSFQGNSEDKKQGLRVQVTTADLLGGVDCTEQTRISVLENKDRM
jgi:hypothetical protein